MALISDNPFLKDLGFELLDMKDGIAEVGINLQAQHMNSWQVMHGGIIMIFLLLSFHSVQHRDEERQKP